MVTTLARLNSLRCYSELNGKVSFWRLGLTDGRGIADACIAYMRENEAPPLLGQIHKAMAVVGVFGAVEIAFWQRIAEYIT